MTGRAHCQRQVAFFVHTGDYPFRFIPITPPPPKKKEKNNRKLILRTFHESQVNKLPCLLSLHTGSRPKSQAIVLYGWKHYCMGLEHHCPPPQF